MVEAKSWWRQYHGEAISWGGNIMGRQYHGEAISWGGNIMGEAKSCYSKKCSRPDRNSMLVKKPKAHDRFCFEFSPFGNSNLFPPAFATLRRGTPPSPCYGAARRLRPATA